MARPSLRLLPLCSLALLSIAACKRDRDAQSPGGAGEAPSAGVDELVSSMDTSADPCVDFYQYACGGWLAQNPRPADKSRYGRSFNTVQDRNEAILRELLEQAAEDSAAGEAEPTTQKLGDYYRACTDMAARDAAGLGPVEALLAKIDGVADKAQLMTVLGELHAGPWGRVGWLGMAADPPLFGIGVDADYKEAPDRYMAIATQSGLGLPSRDMYLPPEGEAGEGGRALLAAYEAHIAKMLVLGGADEAAAVQQAKAVLAIETELARASMTPVALRDDEANYHKEGFEGLKTRAQGLDWAAYFAAAGLPQTAELNIRTPEFFTAMAALVQAKPLPELQAYLRWMLLHAAAPDLDSRFDALNFELVQLVTGVEAQEPLERRCTDGLMFAFPDLIGPRYVERAFPGESKAIADDMVNRINAAMEASFPTLAWMDDTTRGRAADKIAKMTRKIGYPDSWRDYAEVTITPDVHYANVLAEKSEVARRDAAKIGQPVDRSEWHMPTPLVNAYYNPTNNEIVFPAGILQPPFFDADAPMVMNFGGIGAVAGHELTHGFDDEGRKYDASGKLTQWWSPAVSEAFEERVACVVDQYSSYEIAPQKPLNGELTAGENIADIGGVKEAYVAYHQWAAEQGEAAATPVAEGMTNDQVFFVAWAQNWCMQIAEPEAERRRLIDPHSPGKFRAVGPLVDLPAFAEAFTCEVGTPMNPADRCEIW
ncbi:M13 family metallopeptidase [Pseudenhygromyxa sp. WMMC2535]|uniref:M13 family metallopeptidase n=1 Tax=Pseudenhygromyxa sp. WMMC2535 TaxID=2712867 RepID=UPI001551EC54|nr:M13 family metallopeptidase [Pseudenhygromyxa sp. WMMC2535]NVB40997.1 M13 family metallopeptidase [Pseudenhygromyxa sp. WMMC2535]